MTGNLVHMDEKLAKGIARQDVRANDVRGRITDVADVIGDAIAARSHDRRQLEISTERVR